MRGKNDNGRDNRIARAAAESHGVLSLDELFACGLDDDAITRRLRSGRLHRLFRGVYAVGHSAVSREGAWLAAVKAVGDGAVLSHQSAAMLWGFFTFEDRRTEVTIVDTTPRRIPGLGVHRAKILAREDRRRHNGIPVTSPARTIVDLAAVVRGDALRRAVMRVQGRYLANVPEILRAAERAGRRPGSGELRRLLAKGPAPTRSELEDVVLDLLLKAGLPHPDVNRPVWIGDRRLIPDFRWPDLNLVVEADGAAWHGNALAREDDAERQAILEASGDQVLRITWDQAVRNPAHTVKRVQRASGRLDSLATR